MDGTLDGFADGACIDSNLAAAYVAHDLDADEMRSIDGHIDVCPSCRQHLSALVASEDVAPLPGERVGRYVVEAILGEGAMGVVYRAADPELGRSVALKMLRGAATVGDEAKALARVSHRNVVGVHDLLVDHDRIFLALERIDGTSLTEWLRAAPRKVPEILAVFVQAGRGLAAVHAAGIVHRDFKPDNVLVEHGSGRVCVTDFGLASLDPDLARSRAGTVAYMAPEQHRGEAVDARSDQFAFAVALHEAVFGAPPFAGDTSSARREAVLAGAIRAIPVRRTIPARVRRAIQRALAHDPGARFPSMNALVDTLAPAPTRVMLVAVVAVLLVAAGVVVATRPTAPSASDRLAGTWNAARRAEVGRVFLASGNPNAPAIWKETARSVDAWVTDWSALHDETRARTTDGVQLRRRACLEDGLVELRALGDVLARADPSVVDHAIDAAESLPPVARCRDARKLGAPSLVPADPATLRRVLEVRQELAHARVARATFAYAEELRIAERAALAARTIGYAPLVAEALVEHGEAISIVESHAKAEPLLREAIAVAEAARADRTKAIALLSLFDILAFEEKPDLAALVHEQAAAAIERLGGDDELAMKMDFATSEWLLDQARPEDAESPLRRSLAIAESLHGPSSRPVAMRLVLLARCMGLRGDHVQALALNERSLPLFETTGRETPVTMFPHLGIAMELVELLRASEAEAHARIAARIAERDVGEEIATYPRVQLGRVLVDEGRYDEALAVLEPALATQEKYLRPDHAELVDATLALGRARLALGRPTLAIPLFERALAIDSPARRLDRAEAATSLAEALAATGRTPSRARALATEARAMLLAHGGGPRHDRELRRVDAFLGAHR